VLLTPVGQVLAAVGGVGPNLLEPRHTEREARQELARASGVRHIGGGDIGGDRQPKGIDQEMPLASFDLLAAVVATDSSRLLNRLLHSAHP
jgi:hypothetical protein